MRKNVDLLSITVESGTDSHVLADLLLGQPTLMVLLRHFGCPVCREHLLVTQEILGDIKAAGGQVIGIAQGVGMQATQLAQSIDLQYPVYGDSSNAVYRAMELPRASMWNVTLGPILRQPIKAMQRMRHVSKPGKDVQQLGGVGIFDINGKLQWCYRQIDSGDVPANSTVLAQFKTLAALK